MKNDRIKADPTIAASHYPRESDYWINQLSGEPERSQFPYVFNRKGKESQRKKNTLGFEFPNDILGKLFKLNNNSDNRLYMILLAGLVILINKYTGNSDIVVGAPVYKQEVEGHFINTVLALRNRFDDHITFKELLFQVRHTFIEANENQNYPIQTLMYKLNMPYGADDDFPLFDIAVLLENIHDKTYLQEINLNIIFSFSRTGNALKGEVEYNSLLYDKETIDRIITHYMELYRRVFVNLEVPLSGIHLLSEDEKEHLLYRLNTTEARYPKEKTIHQLVEEQVEKTPGNIAVIHREQSLSYMELNETSNRLAHRLKEKGVKLDTIVALMVEPSIDTIVGILGILKAGGAYLAIDPTIPKNRMVTMLEDCGASLLLTGPQVLKNDSFTLLQSYQSVNHTLHMTPRRSQVRDLDSLPVPDRSLVNYEKNNLYIGQAMVKNSMSLQAARGCPYNCAYCHKIWPGKHIYRSAQHIFDEVKTLYNMGVKRFAFVDDIFNLNAENSMKLFELVIKNRMEVRFFFPNGLQGDLLTEEYIDMMVEAGTISLALALETASPRVQELINKNLNLEKLRENIDYLCKKHPGVILELFTMHGFPTETEEEAMKTLDFIKSTKWLHFPYINILKIYPNTDMMKLALENGISREAIARSEVLAHHELSEVLPFDKSFSLKYQADFLDNYFLSKARLLHVLPYQMKALTETEIIQKYNSYLPVTINSFAHLLKFVGVTGEELGGTDCVPEERYFAPGLNEKLKKHFPSQPPSKNALRFLLLDLSQFFTGECSTRHNVVEPPLGPMYVLTYLKHKFGSKINGKICKARVDFDNYQELKAILDEFKPGVIGIRTIIYYKEFFHRTAAMIRSWGFEGAIIAGGPYATSNYETILQDSHIDIVVLGEGELTITDLMGRILENKGKLPEEEVLKKIAGIAFMPRKPAPTKKFAREILMMDGLTGVLPRIPGQNPGHINKSGNLAYILFTSGTTGKPKGVLIEHQGLANYIWWAAKEYVKNEKVNFPFYSSISFDLTVTSIFTPLITGNTIFVYREEEKEPLIEKIIDDKHINVIKLTPPHLKLIRHKEIDSSNTNIKRLIVGGEKLDTSLAQDISKNFKGNIEIYNEYGPTETVVGCMIHKFDPAADNTQSVPVGIPADNVRIYVLDKNHIPLPPGAVGEIYISGDGVARGYLNRPELTMEKFIGNHFIPSRGKRMYKTGDLARWLPEGNLEFLGRTDHQVKIRGYRIEPGEIESQLQKKEGIKDTVVLALEDNTHEKYLCAYIVSDNQLEAAELRNYLSEYLQDYMIPSYFMGVESIPLTASGKVDKKALPDPALTAGEEYVPPKNEIEANLVEIWKDVLGRENIGTSESFLMIGGDSIKAIQISARMNTAGYKVRLRDIFQNPSIAELAPIVKKANRIGIQSAVSGAVPLTPRQHWFFKEKCIDNHYLNQAVMIYSGEGFDEKGIKAVFEKIQEHHDALRIVYNEENGTFRQEIKGLDHPISLQVHDLRNCEHAVKILENKANKIQESINLQKGPLMKLGLFHLDDGDRLLIVIHHLLIDGISWRLLFEDMDTLYHQYRNGEEFELPLKTDSFKLWSEKLSQYANSEEFLKEKTHWWKLESMTATVPRIEKDFEEDCNYQKDSETLSFHLNEEQTNLLLTKVHEAFGTEINDILLISLGLGIKRSWGHPRLLIALEGHGREDIADIDISRTIGWFTSVYPVILDFSYENDLSLQVKKVKETLRQIPNRGIGYEILKYLTSVEHKSGITFKLKPQVGFNYLGQFDRDVERKSFTIARESTGNSTSLKGTRDYQVEINGMTTNQQLIMSISYNKKHFKKESIQALANHYKDELIRVINYCAALETKQLTPSDLTYKSLSIEELDRLTGQYPVEDIWPLTPMQEGFYFIALADDLSLSFAYFEQMSYHLQGHLNISYVEKSLNELLKRYDTLRAAFVHENLKCPLQIILKERKIDFYYKDLRNTGDNEEKVSFINQFKEQDRKRSFNLSKDSLMRVSILHLHEREYEFTWSFHHILMDGWCIGILISEFFEIYNSFLANRPYQLPGVKPYRAYIQWLEQQDKQISKVYWEKYLEGFEEVTPIPQMSVLPKREEGYKNERVSLELEREKTAGLNRLAAANQVTLNTVVQTLWAIILGKYNCKEDVVFGVVVSVRPSAVDGIETMVGLFINTIPVRITFEGNMTFRQVFTRIQENALQGESHHYYSLGRIQAAHVLKQNLLDHIFVFENYPVAVQVEGFREDHRETNARPLFRISGVRQFAQTNFDFNIIVLPSERLTVEFYYNANRYAGDFLQRITGHLTWVVDQVLENQDREIARLTFLSPEEKKQLIHEFNQTHRDYPRDKTIYQLFEDYVEQAPYHLALAGMGTRAEKTGQFTQLTYRQVHEKANQLARFLQTNGIITDTIVGLMMERSIDMLIAILGILKAGGAYLPIDPAYPGERIKFMLADSGAKILITIRILFEDGKMGRWEDGKNLEIVLLDFSTLLPFYSSALPFSHLHLQPAPATALSSSSTLTCQVSPANLAYIIYTSGSTGKPKGVMIEHRGIASLSRFHHDRFHIREMDKIILFASISFDASVWETFMALLNGAALYPLWDQIIGDYKVFESYMNTHCITIATLPPEYAVHLSPERLISYRLLITAGSSPPLELVNAWKEEIEYVNAYGPTEVTICATYDRVEKNRVVERVTIGKPIHNTYIYITDPHLNNQPIGIAGELCIGGVGAARGYLNQPELTAERFIELEVKVEEKNKKMSHQQPHASMQSCIHASMHYPITPSPHLPHSPYSPIYRTGDLARWLFDGRIEFLGRIDDQVKIRGFRIELGEIENYLLEIEGIMQACVIVREMKSGQEYLCAYYVGRQSIDSEETRNILSRSLPGYMIPTYFISLERIPLTPSGKVDRGALSSPEAGAAKEYISPRTPNEEIITRAWQQVLELDQVGVDNNFFDLGGTSLDIIRVNTRLKEVFKKDIPLAAILRYPTVRLLAAHIIGEGDKEEFTGDLREGALERGKKDRMRRLQKKRSQ